MNILDVLMQAQGGQATSTLGQRFGLNQGQTQSALEALLPALAGAVNQNAQQSGGLDALLGALSGGQHGRYLDDPSAIADPGTTQDGNGILGHLFGSKEVSREVASRASAQTGIGADILKQMLPVVAAMMMGGLSRRAQSGGMSAAPGGMQSGGMGGMGGLGAVLGSVLGGGSAAGGGGAAQPSGGGLLDMLTPMLDRNRDGSAVDDLLGMAASFLGRR